MSVTEENITMEITEPVVDLGKELSELILDTDRPLLVKYNYPEGAFDIEDKLAMPDAFYCIHNFLRDSGVKIKFSTCGLHLEGENGRPHLHYHMICSELPSGTFQSNQSLHRKRWLAKADNSNETLDGVSISMPKKTDPAWQTLAYPWKEGNVIKDKSVNKGLNKYAKFLYEYATNLYQQKLAQNARNDACVERKKNKLLNLGKLCEDNKNEFNSYSGMLKWLDKNYIAELPLEEKPCYNKYKTDTFSIAVHLGYASYSQMILSPHTL